MTWDANGANAACVNCGAAAGVACFSDCPTLRLEEANDHARARIAQIPHVEEVLEAAAVRASVWEATARRVADELRGERERSALILAALAVALDRVEFLEDRVESQIEDVCGWLEGQHQHRAVVELIREEYPR